jgi:hypothetical protein
MKPLDEIGSIGSPTTVVYASELSAPAILAGIRAGHVFIDLTGSRDRTLEMTATSGNETANMGDILKASKDAAVRFDVQTADVATGRVVFVEDGKELSSPADSAIAGPDQIKHLVWTSDGKRHWIRADVIGPDGKLWLLGNPVYVNWEGAGAASPKE